MVSSGTVVGLDAVLDPRRVELLGAHVVPGHVVLHRQTRAQVSRVQRQLRDTKTQSVCASSRNLFEWIPLGFESMHALVTPA